MAKKKITKRKRGGATFACTKCGGKTHVLTTRRKEDGLVVRDRMCATKRCGNRFRTQEAA